MLSRDSLVTVRFSALKAFDAVAERCTAQDERPTCSLEVFTALCEEMVDRLADSLEAVCQECGKKHAPSLAALVHLAHVAERVGRKGRQTLVPSFGALLDLAHAAENYSSAQPQTGKRAA